MGSLAFSSDTGWAREAYRPDVDGLRALAVLAIFAFHLGLAGSPGGFVGVDVFFVISGFVITRGVLLELDQQRFSLQAFYLRRARRILPALIVTLLGTLCVGSIILSPSETREFAGSALASLISAANVFFTTAPTTLPTPPTTDRSYTPGRSAWKSSSICCSR